MNHYFKRAAAAALSACLLCTGTAFSAVYAADTTESPTVTLNFDLSEEGVTIAPDEDGNPMELNPVESDPNASIRIPEVYLEREGYGFSGWTLDGIRGYVPGEVIQISDQDLTLKPVWYDLDDEEMHSVTYTVYIGGELYDTAKILPKQNKLKNQFVKISLLGFDDPGKFQLGWFAENTHFRGEQSLIVPDHDVDITPYWLDIYTVYYSAGDVDRISGSPSASVEHPETISFQLAAKDRLARKGFTLSGWKSSIDGEIYEPLMEFTMPSSDITFTAVWEPITYNVLFIPGTKSSDIIKVQGATDTYITVPEVGTTKSGYYFDGWKINEQVYQPGDKYLIEGATPGLGISFTAVWVAGVKPTETPVSTLLGDANCDSQVNMADAVLIMQYLSNPDIYGVGKADGITEQGIKNADTCDPGSGVTNADALSIQKWTLKLLEELPEISDVNRE